MQKIEGKQSQFDVEALQQSRYLATVPTTRLYCVSHILAETTIAYSNTYLNLKKSIYWYSIV